LPGALPPLPFIVADAYADSWPFHHCDLLVLIALLCLGLLRSPSFVPGAAVHHIAPTITSQQQIVAKVDGLVGDSAPLGFFDPLGYTKKASPADLKKYAGHSLPASAMLRRFSPCFDCVVTSLLWTRRVWRWAS